MTRKRIQFSHEVQDRASTSLRNVSKETENLASSFKRMAAVAGAAFGARELIE